MILNNNIVLKDPRSGKEIPIDECFINNIGDYSVIELPLTLFFKEKDKNISKKDEKVLTLDF